MTAQRPPSDESGFAMVQLLLFLMALSAVIPLLTVQVMVEARQTTFENRHSQALNDAYTGLYATLNLIRNTTTAPGTGAFAALPCTDGASVTVQTGSADATGTRPWTARIYYLGVDPSGMTEAQAAATALTCPLSNVPAYAFVSATGQQSTSPNRPGRTLTGTYVFSTQAVASVGGRISSSGKCWDAGSAPVVGTRPTFQPCQVAGTASQLWVQRPDNSIMWWGNTAANLCLDWRGVAASPADPALRLETCIGTGQSGTAYNTATQSYPRPGQMYQELAGHWAYLNVTADGGEGSMCVNSYNPTTRAVGQSNTGDLLYMSSDCTNAPIPGGAGVGAGAAGGDMTGLPGPTKQLVNLKTGARCLDILHENPSEGMITYPCHQAPDPAKNKKNQEFTYSGTVTTPGTLSSTDLTKYGTVCLTSTGATRITVGTCTGAAGQKWQFTGIISGDYANSYQIRDNWGQCLTGGPGDVLVEEATLGPCTADAAQKWNATLEITPARMKTVLEPQAT